MGASGVFAQRGNTRRFTAGPWPAPSSIRMSVATGMPQADNYIITNFGPSVAFVGYGSNSAEAIANADVPVDGDTTGEFCFIVPPGQISIEAKHGVYFAAVTVSGTADIFITPGIGEVTSGVPDQTSNEEFGTLFLYAQAQQELMQKILIELRTQTEFLKQGLNVADDPDSIRGDQTDSIN